MTGCPRLAVHDSLSTSFPRAVSLNPFWILNDRFPIKTNPKLVYKIDVYCIGRTLQYLLYHYNTTFYGGGCYQLFFMKKSNSLTEIKKIIDSYTTNDVHLRPYIIDQNKSIATMI